MLMKRLVYTFNMFYLLGLSLWVGGMFLLGILVEIIVRIKLKEQPLLASKVMNTIMDVFNIEIIYICIGFMVSAEIIKRLVGKFSKLEFEQLGVTKRRFVKAPPLGIMIVLAIYMGSFLRPEMHEVDKLKKTNPTDQKLQIRFDRFHSKFVNIYSVNMILGLSLLYIHGKEMTRFRKNPNETDE
jgi:hypothetical protein